MLGGEEPVLAQAMDARIPTCVRVRVSVRVCERAREREVAWPYWLLSEFVVKHSPANRFISVGPVKLECGILGFKL